MEIPRQEYRNGLPFPSPGDFPNPRMEPRSPKLQADSLPSELQRSLLEGKRVCVDRHTGKLRESRLHGSLTLFCGVFLLDFLWSIILFSLVLRPYVVYLKVLPCAHVHLSARMDSSKEAKGTLTSPIMGVTLSLFDSQGVFLCRCH